MNNILVIGGSNIDFSARASKELINNDSNIGKVTFSFGGVARNIACNLSLLGNKIIFITSLGKDHLSLSLKKDLRRYKIKAISPKLSSKESCGVGSYIAINDSSGEMYLALCDLKFCDLLKYDDLLPYKRYIDSNKDIVIDTNLNEELINKLINNNPNKRYYVDGVSSSKVVRLRKVLSKLFLFKSNLIEAQTLLNKKESGDKLVDELLSIGIKNIIITSGANNIYYGFNNKSYVTSPLKINKDEIKSVNGAGDAFFSGFVSNYIKTNDFNSSIEIAKKMSYYTLLSDKAINDDIACKIKQ